MLKECMLSEIQQFCVRIYQQPNNFEAQHMHPRQRFQSIDSPDEDLMPQDSSPIVNAFDISHTLVSHLMPMDMDQHPKFEQSLQTEQMGSNLQQTHEQFKGRLLPTLYEGRSSNESPVQFQPALLSKKEETDMLYSIKLYTPLESQNLLDLTCEETNPRTSRQFNYKSFIEDRVVEITGPITIQEGYVTSYKLYKIKTKSVNKPIFNPGSKIKPKVGSQEEYQQEGSEEQTSWETVVDRRYSDFEYLYQVLIDKYGGCLVPKLPSKSVWTTLNMETASYMWERKQKLQKFIDKIMAHRKLKESDEFISFLIDPDNSFSSRKGQYYNSISMQSSIQKLTISTLESGSSLISKLLPESITSTLSLPGIISQLSMEPIPTSLRNVHAMTITKEDQEIMNYEMIVGGLTEVIKQLGVAVEGCADASLVDEFNCICNGLLSDDEPTNLTSKQFRVRRETDDLPMPYQHFPNTKYSSLLSTYEALFELIEEFQQALGRRSRLAQSLQSLQYQLETLQQKSRNNPRNINLDILRSKIQTTSVKYEQFTEELLQELGSQVAVGKDMIAGFVGLLVEHRKEVYTEARSYSLTKCQ